MKWALFERAPQFEFGNERIVLIGDACHPMRPFMSQGAAMALEDATILLRALLCAPDSASAFSTYAQCRSARLGEVHRVSAANTFMRGPTEPDWVFGYDALTAHASLALLPLPLELAWLAGASASAARMALPTPLSLERSVGGERGASLLYIYKRLYITRPKEKGSACAEPFKSLVGRTGFEPVTNGLKVRCSTS